MLKQLVMCNNYLRAYDYIVYLLLFKLGKRAKAFLAAPPSISRPQPLNDPK